MRSELPKRTCEITADFTTGEAATVISVQTSPPIMGAGLGDSSNKDCTCSNSTTSTSRPTES